MSDLAPLAILSKGFFDEVVSRQQNEIHTLKQTISHQHLEIEELKAKSQRFSPPDGWIIGAIVRYQSHIRIPPTHFIIRTINETQIDLGMRPIPFYATFSIQEETPGGFEGEIREWGNIYNIFELVPNYS